jgi:hypothetical protein
MNFFSFQCPVCSHSFLSVDYLQAHIHRRHPEYDPDRRREHDVDVEKEVQRLRNDLQSKETELQLIKLQKVCEKKIFINTVWRYKTRPEPVCTY